MPATIVGSANGRSITALMTALPRKRSRTSTQATSVPATALIAATRIDRTSVSFSAATACGAVTASQKAPSPPSSERATTAASGIRTMTLSHSVATPSASAPDPPGAAEERARRRATGSDRPALRASLGSGDSRGLLDRGDRPLVRVEELVVDLRPAAEVADREEALRCRDLRGVLVEDRLVHRAVAPVGEPLLGVGREREVEERLRLLRMRRRRHDRDRVLDEDRLVGDDVVDLLAPLLRRDCLVLVGDQDVAGAGDEVVQRLAAGLVLDDDVLGHQLAQVREPRLSVLAAAALRTVRGEDVPLRRARGERVRREDLDARL